MGRRRAKTALITFIVTFLVVAAIAGFICYKLVSDRQVIIDTLTAQKADAQVYAFARDLKANTIITMNDIKKIDIKSESKTSGMYLDPSSMKYTDPVQKKEMPGFMDDNGSLHNSFTYFDKNQQMHNYAVHYVASKDEEGKDLYSFTDVLVDDDIIGRMVKTNVSMNTPILDSVLYVKDEGKPATDLRVQEFNFIQIPSDVEEGDFIDVRIQFPTGENYRVITAKRVEKSHMTDKDGVGQHTIFINLTERDTVVLASAVIEAYMQDGVKLYAVKYTDPANQVFNETIEDYVKKYEAGLETAMLRKDFEQISEAFKAKYEAENGVPMAADIDVLVVPYGPSGENVDFTFEFYRDLPDEERATAFNVEYTPTKEEDIKDEEIAQEAGMRIEHVSAIRNALKDSENNASVLNYYRAMRVKTKIEIASTYPVKEEVLNVIKNNPDIVDTVYAYYSELVNKDTKYDKLLQLWAEYEKAPETKQTDPYGYGGQGEEVKTKDDIMQEIKALLDERAKNVQENLETEATQQRKDRISYLSNLLGLSTGEEE